MMNTYLSKTLYFITSILSFLFAHSWLAKYCQKIFYEFYLANYKLALMIPFSVTDLSKIHKALTFFKNFIVLNLTILLLTYTILMSYSEIANIPFTIYRNIANK